MTHVPTAITSSIPDAATYYVDIERFANMLIQRVSAHPKGSIKQHLEAFLASFDGAVTNVEVIAAINEFVSYPDLNVDEKL